MFLLFDRFGPYQSGTGYRARLVERVSAGSAELEPAIVTPHPLHHYDRLAENRSEHDDDHDNERG